jgi:hypothetical protein
MEPWHHHPSLTSDRLVTVAGLILKGRSNALGRHEPEIGDDRWILGSRAFSCAKYEIVQASQKIEWLEAIENGLELTFKIGGVPLRFYRGEPTDPHERTLRRTFPELAQPPLPFIDDAQSDLLLRIAVDTDEDGEVLQMSLVALKGDQPAWVWPIPYDKTPATIVPLGGPIDPGKEIPAPVVSLPSDKEDKKVG